MNSPEIKAFIKEYSYLFWSTAEEAKENMSNEQLVETILNYGDLQAVKKLFDLLGIEKVAEIFHKATTHRKRINYFEPVVNFFNIYFNHNVSGYTDK